jgi:hypothetical protein
VAGEAGPVRAADPVSARLHTRLVRARLSIASRDTATARREIRTGLAELAHHQAQFGSIDLQTASAVHGRQLVELDLSLALAQGRPAGVLAAIERGRATSSRLPRLSAPSDPVVADLLAALRRSGEALRAISSDASAAEQATVQRRRVAELQRELRARSWQAAGSGSVPQPASMEQIEAELGRTGTALTCYFDVGGVLYAVVMAGGRSRIVAIGSSATVSELVRRVRADLDVLASGRLPGALLVTVCATLNRSLAALADVLLVPLELGDDRVVIVPTGVLAALPWTNLAPMRGRPVVVAPSATAWLSASARGPGRTDGPVVAVAGPDLAHSEQEVRAIGEAWPGARVLARGSRDELVSALSSATVVHVAAHGQHHADNPLFSQIRLTDGPLFAYELDHTSLAAEHVVLSACELGQATIRAGDEALGLTSVLLRLGSRSVISGVARVPDDVAAEVMTRYHGALAGGLDSASALAGACVGSATPAPFVCFGATW